ncbi:NAD-dependent epimerase/dehydratase family protein [Marinobacter salsuginis]|uniref:NAD-dependent epimerase/dehydratase family protein n=1 Tax=Marinobacter salsuginis TaxID=418719 RepID=UPI001C940F56|nr:NAD-dependent epimerase/dehydratase family protein [Marinobacter salsuginis]MBY6070775.1 NAD-dependent epimerase/dehydratase family protein [Marinobacter salsuginis]
MAGGKKILVTGASGFIGKELCKVLVERGFLVTALVRSEKRLPCAGIDCLVQDLDRQFDVDILAGDFDAVIHLAGKAHGRGGAGDQTPEAFERSNVEPTRHLAECAASGGIQRFIYLSSIGVHGDSTSGSPITEQSGERPHADYARSKLRGEIALRESLSGSSTAFCIIRPTLVYGENAPGNFGRLVALCRRGLPLPFRNVNNRRSMVSLDSLVHLIILCIERPEAENQVFVAADENPVSTGDIIRSLRTGMGKGAGLIPVPVGVLRGILSIFGRSPVYRQLFGDLEVDASKAVNLLGWKREADTSGRLQLIGKKAKAGE